MRILCTTQPAHGHFRPLIPVATALAARGHEVRFGTSARFASVVVGEAFEHEAVGLDWLEADKSTIPPDAKAPPTATTLELFFAHQFVRMTAERLARDVIELAERWTPDLILRETTEYGAILAGQALGVPTAAVQVGSPSLLSPSVVAEVRIALDEARARMGLSTDPAGERLAAELVICIAPPDLHDPTVPLPRGLRSFRPAPLAGPESLPPELEHLGKSRPLVYATLGTVFNSAYYDLPFFPAVIDALRDMPLDLLVSVGPGADPAALGRQPSNVRVASYAPQRAVMDRCRLVICHGGYGTVLDAVDAAVPLVVVPFGADQYINAESVERVGIGRMINDEELTADRVREAASSVMADPAFGQRITGLRADWHALPGPDAAAAEVERLAEQPGSRTGSAAAGD